MAEQNNLPITSHSSSFMKNFLNLSEEKRKSESLRILNKYPDRVPVIINPIDNKAPPISNHKYLVPTNITLGQYMHIVRPKIKISPKEALFFFIGNTKLICPAGESISTIYSKYANNDGYLYIYYNIESAFGG
jgi:GABA(A) receptor-associated protein